MEMLSEQDLENIVGGFKNYMNEIPEKDALKIAESLSNDKRARIPNIRQPLTRDEFIKFWENSNNKSL